MAAPQILLHLGQPGGAGFLAENQVIAQHHFIDSGLVFTRKDGFYVKALIAYGQEYPVILGSLLLCKI